MRLLIDGYNLLHASDVFGAGALAGTLRGSREALLAWLAERLTERERRATVIVFDAADAPPGLPDQQTFEGITVRFARDYPDADALIEELLMTTPGRRQVTVVSGDHRVQRAARSSGARWVDSEAWVAELRSRPVASDASPAKPVGVVEDNTAWVRAFSNPADLAAVQRSAEESPLPSAGSPTDTSSAASPAPAESPPPAKNRAPRRRRRGGPLSSDKPSSSEFGDGIDGLFPPGYADDLLNES